MMAGPLAPWEQKNSASDFVQTGVGLLRQRALYPWTDAVLQYLAVRIGDVERARIAHRALCRRLESLDPTELLQDAPGPRAWLYRMAREIAMSEAAMPGPRDPRALAFRDSPEASGIQRIRQELSADDAELLELRFARELDIEEIAYVREQSEVDVEFRLETAIETAERALGRTRSRSLLVEAFAVDVGPAPPLRPAAERSALPPGSLIGRRYRILERVGVGAFGDVYRAQDIEVEGHTVALKLLHEPSPSESAKDAARRELRLNAAVSHPSLVQFKDHGWFEERLWFVMPWYEGETLETRLTHGAMDVREARSVFEQLARALAALHAAGIRHQDVKPDNVVLTQLAGEDQTLPILIDLGVAAEAQETLFGGTPLYFAPEVAARFTDGAATGHALPIGPKADVFALALCLRNALEPDTQDDVAAGAVGAFVSRRAQTPPAPPKSHRLRYLRRHFERWLHPDPEERPSALQFASELALLTRPQEQRTARTATLRWAVPTAMLTLALLGAIGWAVYDRAQHQEARADHAHESAADARANLFIARAQQRTLSAGNRHLREAQAATERERRELDRDLRNERVRSARQVGELRASRDARLFAERRADQLLRDLIAERAELRVSLDENTRLAADLEASRAELGALRVDVGEARDQLFELGAELATARAQAEAAERRLRAATAAIAPAPTESAELTPSGEAEAPEAPLPQSPGASAVARDQPLEPPGVD